MPPWQPDHGTRFSWSSRFGAEIPNDPHDALDKFDIVSETAARRRPA